MATYDYSGTFPSSPSVGETMTMNGVTYEYTSKGAWSVLAGTNAVHTVGDGGLTTNDFTNADHTKLNGIEASATADQTKADIEGLNIDVPAANLTGTIADARFPATLPAISGANLTDISSVG